MEEYKHVNKKYLREVRKLRYPRQYRKRAIMLGVYRMIKVILIILAILSILGIYGSLSGQRGEFWEITGTITNIAIVLSIIIIIFYFSKE
jgi:hypothetical protein